MYTNEQVYSILTTIKFNLEKAKSKRSLHYRIAQDLVTDLLINMPTEK